MKICCIPASLFRKRRRDQWWNVSHFTLHLHRSTADKCSAFTGSVSVFRRSLLVSVPVAQMGEEKGLTLVYLLVVVLSLVAFGFAVAAELRRSTGHVFEETVKKFIVLCLQLRCRHWLWSWRVSISFLEPVAADGHDSVYVFRKAVSPRWRSSLVHHLHCLIMVHFARLNYARCPKLNAPHRLMLTIHNSVKPFKPRTYLAPH
uniref:Transmembrane protein n=2 Tax=Kalanchoe fedtschenkoi TaxID=63787 RepID=A0A7N0U296_KALFE